MQGSPHVHVYASHLRWRGSTGAGYAAYTRDHEVVTPPATAGLRLSADRAFRGNADRVNPEQMLVAAASSCQLLSFLALAARHGVDVVGYEDAARGFMPVDDPPLRVSRLELAPSITVAAGTDRDLVLYLVQEAHEKCYIANSLRTDVVVTAQVQVAAPPGDQGPVSGRPRPDTSRGAGPTG